MWRKVGCQDVRGWDDKGQSGPRSERVINCSAHQMRGVLIGNYSSLLIALYLLEKHIFSQMTVCYHQAGVTNETHLFWSRKHLSQCPISLTHPVWYPLLQRQIA